MPSRARKLASSQRDETASSQRGELAICELAICKIVCSRRGELAVCELAMCEIVCSRRGELATCEIARLDSRDCGGDGIVPDTHKYGSRDYKQSYRHRAGRTLPKKLT